MFVENFVVFVWVLVNLTVPADLTSVFVLTEAGFAQVELVVKGFCEALFTTWIIMFTLALFTF